MGAGTQKHFKSISVAWTVGGLCERATRRQRSMTETPEAHRKAQGHQVYAGWLDSSSTNRYADDSILEPENTCKPSQKHLVCYT